MLHLLADRRLSSAVCQRIAAGDDVVLLSESVWSACSGHQDNRLLQALLQNSCRVFAMLDLVEAFGIAESRLLSGIQVIDYDTLVALSVQHQQIHTWC